MVKRVNISTLQALVLPISRREGRGVYFVRLCEWSEAVEAAVSTYYGVALQRGVAIEGQIPNPDDRQLAYLKEMIGDDFRPEASFIAEKLKRWMPRMGDAHRQDFAQGLCGQFDELRQRGKTESILRNVYFKLMCWLYYKFERLMPFLGQDDPPRIIYLTRGITAHELMLLRLLNGMGADVLLLEPDGDAPYLKQDPQSAHAQRFEASGAPFPKDFSLRQFNKPTPAAPPSPAPRPRPVQRALDPYSYFQKPLRTPHTNAWMKAADYREILTPASQRGDDFNLFYNALIRLKGVRDRAEYLSSLHQFYQQLKNTGRRIAIVEEGLQLPDAEAVAKIRRRSYKSPEEMAVDLAGNLPACADQELQREMQRAFIDTVLAASKEEPALGRLLISAVYVLCWIKQYQAALFQGYRAGDLSCFILMGGCRSVHDVSYLRFLSLLPVDILICAPDLDHPCLFHSNALLELEGEASMKTPRFPRDAATMQMRTLAAHAKEDLDQLLYTDSGLYRNRQFAMASAMTLETTYDELFILWDQELRYRTGFGTAERTVTMPVVWAKISGVEGGNLEAYWQKVRLLTGRDTRYYDHMPILAPGSANPLQSLALKVLRDGQFRRRALMEDRQYPFAMLREELQVHLLDKVQLMLDRRLIRGIYENGTEYTVLSTVLNMDKSLLRVLQSFDFTRKNPKIVAVCTGEGGGSLEDAIMLTFLHLVGFDVCLFVPTGYQVIERYLNDHLPVEHQIGDYCYDLTVPDLDQLPPVKGRSWWEGLFRRQ